MFGFPLVLLIQTTGIIQQRVSYFLLSNVVVILVVMVMMVMMVMVHRALGGVQDDILMLEPLR